MWKVYERNAFVGVAGVCNGAMLLLPRGTILEYGGIWGETRN